jgi:hypothetical protein
MKMLAWLAFVLAIIAGAGLSASNPGLVQLLVVVALLTALGIDIAKDRVPNLVAVAVVVTLPSLIVGMNGKLAGTINRWLDSLWNNVSDALGQWAGTTSTFTIAVACVVVSYLIARRTMPRSGGGR